MAEVERKFAVTHLPDDRPARPAARIRQGYLALDPAEVRLRSSDDTTHELTVKSVGGLSRAEVNLPLTRDQFDELWPLVQCEIEKARSVYEIGSWKAEVDVYGGKLEGLVIAEVEFGSEAEAHDFVPPAWFGPELTGDPRFRNSALATAAGPPEIILPA